MIFTSHRTVFVVVFFTEAVLWTGPVLSGNCFSPSSAITSPGHENRASSETGANSVRITRTPSHGHQSTPPRLRHPPPNAGIMPIASFLPLCRSLSAPAAYSPSPLSPTSRSGPTTSATPVRYANRELTATDAQRASTREQAPSTATASPSRSGTANGRRASLLERRLFASKQPANLLSAAGGSGSQSLRYIRLPNQISIPTDENRPTLVRSRSTHRRRNSSPGVSPLSIIREHAKEEHSVPDETS